nr:MAG TPA: hypothetical protein [Caudoviricetes sp.]
MTLNQYKSETYKNIFKNLLHYRYFSGNIYT